jgi:uncharacterized protein YceK
MTRRGFTILLVLGLTCAASGCGTLHNVGLGGCCCGGGRAERLKVYGGVRHDLTAAGESAAEVVAGVDPLPRRVGMMALQGVVTVVDLPLSAVADTLLLPVTVRAAVARQQPASVSSSAEEKGEK